MTKQEKTFEEIFVELKQKMGTHKASEIVGTAIINYSNWEFKSPLHAVMRVLYECKKRTGFLSRYDDAKLETIAFDAVETRSYKPRSNLSLECERIDYINNLHASAYGLDLIREGKAADYKHADSRASLVCARIADKIGLNETTFNSYTRVLINEAIAEFFSLLTDRQLVLFQRAVALYKRDTSIKDGLGSSYRSLALATKQIGLTPVEACEVYLRNKAS